MKQDNVINALLGREINLDGQKRSFKVAREIGRGGNSIVFGLETLVLNSSQQEDFVAKFYIPPDSRELDSNAYKRFEQEIELTRQTHHPFVLHAEGTGCISLGSYQLPYYVMPRAEKTLRSLIPLQFDLKQSNERLQVIFRVMIGVSYLHHQGIVHRDLKPENILLFQANLPKVADLGIARIKPRYRCSPDRDRITTPDDELMNWTYYAPEQRHGDATEVDQRADIYALGCILYELITGVPPDRPSLPHLSVYSDGFGRLHEIFSKMIAYSPDDRYQQLDLAIDDLAGSLFNLAG